MVSNKGGADDNQEEYENPYEVEDGEEFNE